MKNWFEKLSKRLRRKVYSDARAYTVLELLQGYDLPDDFPFPDWAIDEEDLLRAVLGEAFAPKLVQRILEVMPR